MLGSHIGKAKLSLAAKNLSYQKAARKIGEILAEIEAMPWPLKNYPKRSRQIFLS